MVKFCHHPNEVRTSASGVAHAKFLLSSKLSVTFRGRMTMAAMRMPVARIDKANLIQACRLIADIYISISTETFDIENIKYEKKLATVRSRYIL